MERALVKTPATTADEARDVREHSALTSEVTRLLSFIENRPRAITFHRHGEKPPREPRNACLCCGVVQPRAGEGIHLDLCLVPGTRKLLRAILAREYDDALFPSAIEERNEDSLILACRTELPARGKPERRFRKTWDTIERHLRDHDWLDAGAPDVKHLDWLGLFGTRSDPIETITVPR